MCGIVGYTGQENAAAILLSNLKQLEYRGYDSCGMALNSAGALNTLKGVGGIDEANAKLNFVSLTGTVGIAHTRWATHGGVSEANAHPHLSNDGNFAIVHNGVIYNYEELREKLLKKGYRFLSATDSEVIANLLQDFYHETSEVKSALEKTIAALDGCYALAITSLHEPNLLYGARFLLPLVIGLDKQASFLSSDVVAFSDYAKQAVLLEDREYAILSPGHYEIYDFSGARLNQRSSFTIDKKVSQLIGKGDYEHYMLKEIFEQPQAILNAVAIAPDELEKIATPCFAAEHIYLVGIGTTFYVASSASQFFHEYGKTPATALPSDEFSFYFDHSPKNHALFISQSGETYDTKEALAYATEQGMSTSAIVNSPHSTIARRVDFALFQNSGVEVSVVSTKAAIAQLVLLSRIAMRLGVKNKIKSEIDCKEYDKQLITFAKKLLALLPVLTRELEKIAGQWLNYRHILCMGKASYYPIALEAALKIKEVTYIHAEGMSTGFLKHGTLALIDKNVPCIFFIPPRSNKKLYDSTIAAIEEVKARDGVVMGFCESDNRQLKKKLDYPLPLPVFADGCHSFYQLIVMQLFAYQLANKLGLPIDKPRNLAKSVTVP